MAPFTGHDLRRPQANDSTMPSVSGRHHSIVEPHFNLEIAPSSSLSWSPVPASGLAHPGAGFATLLPRAEPPPGHPGVSTDDRVPEFRIHTCACYQEVNACLDVEGACAARMSHLSDAIGLGPEFNMRVLQPLKKSTPSQ